VGRITRYQCACACVCVYVGVGVGEGAGVEASRHILMRHVTQS